MKTAATSILSFRYRAGYHPLDADGARPKIRQKHPGDEPDAAASAWTPSTSARSSRRSGPPEPAKPISPSPRPSKRSKQNRVGRIVLSRPAVEAGESLGFLPGDLQDKLAPYLRPLYDALTERLGTKRLKALAGRRGDRDRAGRLHARPHAQRLFRRDRRGAELHLWPAQDAADAAGLALDDGADRRSRSDRSVERNVGPRRYRDPAGAGSGDRGRCGWAKPTSCATRWWRAC